MAGFILNRRSVIVCPHGGLVTHLPMIRTTYRVDGDLPMLLADHYTVAGCSFMMPTGPTVAPNPCHQIQWSAGSTRLKIQGSPALLDTSVGLCVSIMGIPQGPAIITYCQTREREPMEFTRIDE